MKASEITVLPININLSGEYYSSTIDKGIITGDLRLRELDAFLTGLRSALEGNTVDDKLVQLISEATRLFTPSTGIVLSITSVVDPVAHSMTYSITFKPVNPDSTDTIEKG